MSVVDLNAIDWMAQMYSQGFIDFGPDASSGGQRLALSSKGLGYVTTHASSLPADMRMSSPEEAAKILKEGDYFVNKSGPVTSKLSPMLMSGGDYEWFELWKIVGGVPSYAGCRTDSGSRLGRSRATPHMEPHVFQMPDQRTRGPDVD